MEPMRKSRLSYYKQNRLIEFFCFRFYGSDGGQSVWCQPQDGSLLFSSSARNYCFRAGSQKRSHVRWRDQGG